MTPEQETNKQCALRLGWTQKHSSGPFPGIMLWVTPDGVNCGRVSDYPKGHYYDFHGSVDAAMQLVEKAMNEGWAWRAYQACDSNVFAVSFNTMPGSRHRTGPYFADAPTLSAAICLAFLALPIETTP